MIFVTGVVGARTWLDNLYILSSSPSKENRISAYLRSSRFMENTIYAYLRSSRLRESTIYEKMQVPRSNIGFVRPTPENHKKNRASKTMAKMGLRELKNAISRSRPSRGTCGMDFVVC